MTAKGHFNDLSLLENVDGTGIVWHESTYNSFHSLRSLSIADFNSDTLPDLCYISCSGLVVLENVGNLAFLNHDLNSDNLCRGLVEIFDHNGDLRPDILIGSEYGSNNFTKVIESQEGAFQFSTEIILDSVGGRFLLTSDINNDSVIDVLFGNREIIKYESDTLNHSMTYRLVAYDDTFNETFADLDNDGDVDMVATDGATGKNLFIIENKATTNDYIFYNNIPNEISSNPETTYGVIVTDIDLDSKLDVVNFGYSSISYFMNEGNLMFSGPHIITENESGYIRGLAMIDLNKDGYPDCSYVLYGVNEVRASINKGNSTFTTSYLITDQIIDPEKIGGRDIDGDGNQDIYIADGSSHYVNWISNDSLGIGALHYTDLPSGNRILQMDAADFDLNGFSDFLVYKSGSASRVIYNLDGTAFTTKNDGFAGSGYFLLGDVDLNSRPDILTEDNLYLNLPDTSKFTSIPFNSIGSLHALSDFNGDRTPDLVQNANGDFFLTNIYLGGTCHDGIKNRDEEYIDCGGSFCTDCFLCQGDTIFIQDRPIFYQLDISANNTILSNGRIDRFSSIVFRAGDNVILSSLFEVDKNASFEILIDSCK